MLWQFPTVKKFLCCLTLERGGLVIGWFITVLYGLLALLFFGVLVTESIGFKKGYTTSLAYDFQAGSTSKFEV